MNKGKYIRLIAGIITLVGTFALTLFTFKLGDKIFYVYGMGGFKRINNIFAKPYSIYYYYGAIFIAIYLASGLIQLGGIKVRKLPIFGSILPLFFALIIILNSFNLLPPSFIAMIYLLGDSEPLMKGIIPFDIVILDRTESIGTYCLIAGGVLGIIGSFIKSESY